MHNCTDCTYIYIQTDIYIDKVGFTEIAVYVQPYRMHTSVQTDRHAGIQAYMCI